jgi:hypothetical protein
MGTFSKSFDKSGNYHLTTYITRAIGSAPLELALHRFHRTQQPIG